MARGDPERGARRLPGRQRAFVEDDKLGYYLGLNRPGDPAPRAGVFREVLGFTDPSDLRRAIVEHGKAWPAVLFANREHGPIYNVIGPMEGPSGRRIERMITAWIIEHGTTAPRNITAFPDRRRRV
jgi:hypothetical protein